MLAVVFWLFIVTFFVIDYRERNLSSSDDKPYARPWTLNQLAEDISLEDPIYGPPSDDAETGMKDLLLGKPNTYCLA